MENLIYVAVVIAYFLYQAQQARKAQQRQEEAKRMSGSPADAEEPKASPKHITMEDRMKEIFREMEMKTSPYARPDKTANKKLKTPTDIRSPKPVTPQKKQQKKPLTPFLNVDMTEEELSPEGTPSHMSAQETFIKDDITTFDYNASRKERGVRKINLREAMIAKIILERPDY
ncbi:MAG: hypothetical protein H0V61_01955 [Chitinophagales bacterium]|nr:hypothetical protein [Chitinophagales bacterium]